MIDQRWIAAGTAGRVVRVDADPWLDEPAVDPRARGLARNAAAPVDVLLRLLDTHETDAAGGLRWHPAPPPEVVAAMLDHPSARVRAALATQHHVDPAIQRRLVGDPDERVDARARATLGLPPPDHILSEPLDRLAKQHRRALVTDDELRGELTEILSRDRRRVPVAARHPDPAIRAALAGVLHQVGAGTRADVADLLRADPDPEVRDILARAQAELDRDLHPDGLGNRNGYDYRATLATRRLSRAVIAHVFTRDRGLGGVASIASNPHTPPDVVAALFDDEVIEVRCALALRDDLTAGQLAALAADPDAAVRTAVSVHPGLTEEQRAAIDIDVSHAPWDGRFNRVWDEWRPWHPPAPPLPPLEESMRLAASVNPLLRRRAADDPRLPAAVVAGLAGDTDPEVRALLAHHHPEAPPELLLRVFREDSRHRRFRLTALPGFPTDGLARFAEDPDPAVRALVARDPAADPAVVVRLTADPDAAVRRATAACPRLPAGRILALLDSAEGEAAAANPALPVEVMRSLSRRQEPESFDTV